MTQEADIPKWAWRISAGMLLTVAIYLSQDKLGSIENGVNDALKEQREQRVVITEIKGDMKVMQNDLSNVRGDVDGLKKANADTQQRLYDLQMRVPARMR